MASGSNDHPDCFTFLQIYKILSVYSILKPPKYGNCTVLNEGEPKALVSIEDLKKIFKKKSGKFQETVKDMKKKLDEILMQDDDYELDEVFPLDDDSFALVDHDYCLSPVLDCIIYYATGKFLSDMAIMT